MPSSTSNPTIESEIHDLPSSIYQDLFPNTTIESNLQCGDQSNTACSKNRQPTLSSLQTNEIGHVTSSWKMKGLVLLCMLSLPGKTRFYIAIITTRHSL